MQKTTAALILGIALFAMPLIASAISLQDLQAQVQALLSQIAQVQGQTSVSGGNGASCPRFSRSLSRGMRGTDVGQLQAFLDVSQTGFFGALTEAAVVKFQQSQGISAIGSVGPLTRAALGRRCGTVSSTVSSTIQDQTPAAPISVMSGTTASAPTIRSLEAPHSLTVGQQGTWTVHASASSGMQLNYSVVWGDEQPSAILGALASSLPVQTSPTFTHAYPIAGTYAPTFTVAAGGGSSSQASATVVVGTVTQAPTIMASSTTGASGGAQAAGETRFNAYTTAYGWPDNTPPGGNISNPIIHQSAGGTGTFADPITIAVGHSITGNTDVLDYPAGTTFYIPNLRRYFIVEDTCGDGSTPQNGPCHVGYQGNPWLDMWIGGQNFNSSTVLSCEDEVTGMHLIIKNPAPGYAVAQGPVYNGSCAQQYGDSVVMMQ